LVSAQGIFKPKELTDGPLTLRATLASSFEDEHLGGDKVLYDFAPVTTARDPMPEYGKRNEGTGLRTRQA
jgi:hypothetical protein